MSGTILVTGGCGFLGSHFVEQVFRRKPGWRILVLDALTYAGSVCNIPAVIRNSGRFEFWRGNVTDSKLVSTLVGRADTVVHFAAESHVSRSIVDDRLFFETDVIGTQCVANAVAKHAGRVSRFVHISTSEVYGTALRVPMDEDHPINPMSPYASAKAGADRLIYSYVQTYRIPAVIIRPFNQFGPRQHLEKLVPRIITSMLGSETLCIHGDGLQKRDWSFVVDTCLNILKVLESNRFESLVGQALNVGSGRSVSVLEMINMIFESSSLPKPKVMHVDDRPGNVRNHVASTESFRRKIAVPIRSDLTRRLKETIRWYQTHAEHWSPQMPLRTVPVPLPGGRVELH